MNSINFESLVVTIFELVDDLYQKDEEFIFNRILIVIIPKASTIASIIQTQSKGNVIHSRVFY